MAFKNRLKKPTTRKQCIHVYHPYRGKQGNSYFVSEISRGGYLYLKTASFWLWKSLLIKSYEGKVDIILIGAKQGDSYFVIEISSYLNIHDAMPIWTILLLTIHALLKNNHDAVHLYQTLKTRNVLKKLVLLKM